MNPTKAILVTGFSAKTTSVSYLLHIVLLILLQALGRNLFHLEHHIDHTIQIGGIKIVLGFAAIRTHILLTARPEAISFLHVNRM